MTDLKKLFEVCIWEGCGEDAWSDDLCLKHWRWMEEERTLQQIGTEIKLIKKFKYDRKKGRKKHE